MRPSTLGRFGLFAKTSFTPSSLLFRIPFECLVTEDKIKESVYGRVAIRHAQSKGFTVPPRILMAFFLMGQRAANSSSTDDTNTSTSSSTSSSSSSSSGSFSTYVASLPTAYGTPPFVAETDGGMQLEALAQTPVGARETQRRIEMKHTYDAFFPALSIAAPDLFPSSKSTFLDYLWAHSSICTRLFPSDFATIGQVTHTGKPDTTGDGTPDPCGLLVPLADMLNHSALQWTNKKDKKDKKTGTSTTSSTTSSEQQQHVEWRTTEAGLCCHATSVIAENTEILFSYGDHSNGRCFITYGFCTAKNPSNVVPICLGLHDSTDDSTDSTDSTTSSSILTMSSSTTGNFGRSAMVAAAVDRLVGQNLLQRGQGINSCIVSSLTRTTNKNKEFENTLLKKTDDDVSAAVLKSSTLWTAGRCVVNRDGLIGEMECCSVLHEIVQRHLIHEQKETKRRLDIYKENGSKISNHPDVDFEENFKNVSLYRYGSIESLEWTLELIEMEMARIGTECSEEEVKVCVRTLEERETWLDVPLAKGQTKKWMMIFDDEKNDGDDEERPKKKAKR